MARRMTPISAKPSRLANEPAGQKRAPKVQTQRPEPSESEPKSPRPDKPSGKDPLSEPSRHRRVWAAYLSRGYSRADFARLMGTKYQVVDRWDLGTQTMSLDAFLRAAQLLQYSADELAFGRASATPAPAEEAPKPERSLSAPALRGLLEELNASGEARSALGVHRGSREGRYQDFTRSYVEAWVAAFTERRAAGDTAKQATAAAMISAVNARAQASALRQGTRPISRDELAELGRRLLAAADKS